MRVQWDDCCRSMGSMFTDTTYSQTQNTQHRKICSREDIILHLQYDLRLPLSSSCVFTVEQP